ncbi:MAG: DMT family transporter [Planktomarina sp.]
MPTHYIYLCLAIIAETIGTSALKASDQFTKVGPTIIAIGGFVVALYFMGLTLKFLPVGIVYAIWSGLGIVTITTIGFLFFHQKLDAPALFGIALIIAGVVVINVFSKSTVH